MQRILVTGGNGNLGSQFVELLYEAGQTVRVMSRQTRPENLDTTIEWAQADVVTGHGLEAALENVHTIVNCMSDPVGDPYATDVLGTQKLLSVAKNKGVQYVLHISIVGVDRIMFPYYQAKLGAELAVIESGIPYLISRISQFHRFIDYLISPLRNVEADEYAIPVDVQFQPLSSRDAAAHLVPYVIAAEQTGRLPDFGGTEITRLEDMAKIWLTAQGLPTAIKPATGEENHLPFFSYFGDGFVNGYNTNPDYGVECVTWNEFVQQAYGEPVK